MLRVCWQWRPCCSGPGVRCWLGMLGRRHTLGLMWQWRPWYGGRGVRCWLRGLRGLMQQRLLRVGWQWRPCNELGVRCRLGGLGRPARLVPPGGVLPSWRPGPAGAPPGLRRRRAPPGGLVPPGCLPLPVCWLCWRWRRRRLRLWRRGGRPGVEGCVLLALALGLPLFLALSLWLWRRGGHSLSFAVHRGAMEARWRRAGAVAHEGLMR